LANATYWALGLKHHIEIRRSPKVPRLRITKASRVLEGKRIRWTVVEDRNGWGHFTEVTVPTKRKRTVKVIDFIGGTFVTSYKRSRSKSIPSPGIGKVMELPPSTVGRLLGQKPISI
jgi:hypothetical protein